MSPLAVAILAFSMSIDAFIAALGRGAAAQGATFGAALRTGMVFGAVETLTPIAGWALGVAAGRYVAAVDHWIAFGLLAAVGGRMIFHALTRADAAPAPRPRGAAITGLLATAVGSSLDAMAVGVSLAFIDADILTTALAIGCATTVMATTGVLAGRALGASFGRIAEVAGGMVLIGLGVAIVRSHLGA